MINDNKKIYDTIQKNAGVYQITNTINGKFYIGSSINCQARLIDHFRKLRKNKHINPHLQYAFNKYGEGVFEVEILCCVLDKEQLCSTEQYFLDLYMPYNGEIGYNILPNAKSCLGVKHSPRTRELQSQRMLGEKNHFYGKTHNERAKKLISDANKEWCKKNINSFYGLHHSDKTKELLRQIMIERSKTIKNPMFGKKYPEDRLKRYRERHKTEPFKCDQTGEIFHSTGEAANKLKIPVMGIWSVISGRTNATKGYTFSKLDDTKLGKPLKGRKNRPRFFGKDNKNYGRKHSEEAIKNIRTARQIPPFRCD